MRQRQYSIEMDGGIAYNCQFVSSVFREIVLEECRRISCRWEGPRAVVVPDPESSFWE